MAAADSQPHSLDEVVWRSPPSVQEMEGIHTNSVLHYFARSPFFDGTSNNAVLSTQAMYNPAMYHLVQTRAAFEGHLRTMNGLEFAVVHDPTLEGGSGGGDGGGAWVIRKQNRRKRGGGLPDEIVSLAEYFVVGENVYMAPAVGAVVESRMLSTASALAKLLAKAATLPLFTPATGHTYLPPQPNKAAADRSASSIAGSTRGSKENTPMPDAPPSSSSIPSSQGARGSSVGAADKISAGATKAGSTAADRRAVNMLADSLRLAAQYADEHMDEAPLVGEPGSFIIHKGGSKSFVGSSSGGSGGGSTATPGSQKPPLSVRTSIAVSTQEGDAEGDKTGDGRKGGGKGGGGSGEKSPVSPLSPLTPGGGKKRKKSRSAQGQSSGGKVAPS